MKAEARLCHLSEGQPLPGRCPSPQTAAPTPRLGRQARHSFTRHRLIHLESCERHLHRRVTPNGLQLSRMYVHALLQQRTTC
jgi:hypothetical protein